MLSAYTCRTCRVEYDQATDARCCEIDHETGADETDEHGMPDDRLGHAS